MNSENRLESKINMPRFPLNTSKYYQLDTTQDWVKELLIELNEKADDKSPEEYLAETNLNIELELLKKYKPDTGEFLLVKGKLAANFVTQCVRTLETMNDSIEHNIQACFIDAQRSDDDIFQDQTETFQENEMYELYFYEKNQADLKEMIHEQIFLNINEYPVKNAEAELVWGKESTETKQ